MEELTITIVTVLMMTYRRNNMERKKTKTGLDEKLVR